MAPHKLYLYFSPTRSSLLVLQVVRILGCTSNHIYRNIIGFLCLAIAFAVPPLFVKAKDAKSVRTATEADFAGNWVGYGAEGVYFYRLTLTNGLDGEGVLIFQYNKTVRRYRIQQRKIDFRKWAVSMVLIPDLLT
jgi:hypothetical protein